MKTPETRAIENQALKTAAQQAAVSRSERPQLRVIQGGKKADAPQARSTAPQARSTAPLQAESPAKLKAPAKAKTKAKPEPKAKAKPRAKPATLKAVAKTARRKAA